MPAYTRCEPALLLVTFETDGEEPEQALAPRGARALKTALLMLAKRDELRDGDTLTCRRADEGESATVLQGPGGEP
jgi:hypothetical protein